MFILREDDTIGLFIGESERGKINRKDMSPMWVSVSFRSFHSTWTLILMPKDLYYIAGSFYTDLADVFKTRVNEHASADGVAQSATLTLQRPRRLHGSSPMLA